MHKARNHAAFDDEFYRRVLLLGKDFPEPFSSCELSIDIV